MNISIFTFALLAAQPKFAIHFGLTQPILLHGFNLAADVRYDRFVFTYSHGTALHYDLAPGALSPEEKSAGLELYAPYSTGFGVGVTLIDELYVLADFKLHNLRATIGDERHAYSTITIGAELGWRYFMWRGLFVSPVLRFWPTVWKSESHVEFANGLIHEPIAQGLHGFLGNV